MFHGAGCGTTKRVKSYKQTNEGPLLAAPGLLLASRDCLGCSWLPRAAFGCPGLLHRLPPPPPSPKTYLDVEGGGETGEKPVEKKCGFILKNPWAPSIFREAILDEFGMFILSTKPFMIPNGKLRPTAAGLSHTFPIPLRIFRPLLPSLRLPHRRAHVATIKATLLSTGARFCNNWNTLLLRSSHIYIYERANLS